MKDKISENLRFSDFVCTIYNFVNNRKLLVFICFPFLFSISMVLIVYLVEGHLPTNFEEWASLFALPFGVSVGTYLSFFTDSGNHAAKGNEIAFGCLLTLVYIPIVAVFYVLYRFVRIFLVRYQKCKSSTSKDCKYASLEEKVNKLNELRYQGLISNNDYEEQLSRLINK